MAAEYSITFEWTLQAAPADALRAFTHSTLLRDWLCDWADSDPTPDGHIFLHWRDGHSVVGAYRAIDLPAGPDAPAQLEFTWEHWQNQADGLVRVVVQPQGQGARLLLAHSGPGEEPAGLAKAWESSLENLQSVLESGVDLRVARRPRLGIFIEELTPVALARIGAPVSQGVLIGGTAENSGAQAAGLQKDDLLVELNGVALSGFPTLGQALHGLKAGDRPLVAFYRGGQRQTAALELSSFPLPDLPADAAGLTERCAAMYRQFNQDLAALLDGVSEERAERCPAAGEWNVKELVAHFILMERDFQSWTADMLNDRDIYDDLRMRPNVTPRIRALLERFGSLAALRAELDLAEAETLAVIRAFPPEFAARRKHLFRRAAEWMLVVVPGHLYEEHMEQFKTALAASQAA